MLLAAHPTPRTHFAPSRLLLAILAAACGCGGIASGSADAGPSTPYVGYVVTNFEGEVNAGFFPADSVSLASLSTFAPAASIADLCGSSATVAGNCCFAPRPSTPPALPDGVTAGTLTMSVGSNPGVSLPQDSQVQYTTDGDNAAAPFWSPGDVLQIAASGGVIAAFSSSLQTPGPWDTTPGITGGLVVDRTKDFVQTWTPDAHAGETVTLAMVVGYEGTQIINCQSADGSGQLAVPAQLLAQTQTEGQAITNVFRSANTTVTAANATVVLTATTLVTWTATIP